MRAVDRYITYYKVVNDKYIDEIIFDKQRKSMKLSRNVDESILGSMDINGNYFTEIELPNFIFELIASTIEQTNYKEKKAKGIECFHVYSKGKGKYLDAIIERKNRIYFTDNSSCSNSNCYLDASIFVDHTLMEIIINQLNKLGYRDISGQLNNN